METRRVAGRLIGTKCAFVRTFLFANASSCGEIPLTLCGAIRIRNVVCYHARMKNITLVLGSAREGRESEKVAEYLKSLLEGREDATVTYVDVREHVTRAVTMPPWGAGGANEVPTPWQKIAQGTNAFIFVLPEYNHGYPGEWKLLVDSLYKEYTGKDAYIAGVSDGVFSGVRVADHVKPVLVELGLVPHKTALYVGKVDEAFDDAGAPLDPALSERALKFVDAVCKSA